MWDFTQLEVWKRARALTIDMYRVTSDFPLSERYGLVPQRPRAANSVGANVAEGSARLVGKIERDFWRFRWGVSASLNIT